jgi:hypothetical protein
MRLDVIALGSLLALGYAAPAAADVATADALFRRGLGAMEAGRYAEGCAALAESQRLDPRLGTLFTLAECRSKEGKIATAVALYDDFLAAMDRLPPGEQARQGARQRVAGEKRRALEPHVPRLVLRLPAGVSASVTRDDVSLRPPALGIPLPVDPGEHQITTQLDHGTVHRQTITVDLDEEKIVDLQVVPQEAPSAASVPALPPPDPGPRREDPRARAEPAGGGRRTAAWITGGLGVAGLAVGAGTGAAVLVKRSTVASHCSAGACDARGLAAVSSARPIGTASTAGFVIGGAGLATAIVLYLTARPAGGSASALGSFRPVVALASRGAFLGAGKEF